MNNQTTQSVIDILIERNWFLWGLPNWVIILIFCISIIGLGIMFDKLFAKGGREE